VQITAGVPALLGKLVDQTDDGVADEVRLFLELGQIDGASVGELGDRCGGLLGDDAKTALCDRECDFNLDIARDRRLVAKHRTHLGRAERVAENL
jgi:hypothetical protein